MAHDTKPAACIDSICRRDDRPRYSWADLRRFRNGVAACRALGPRLNGSCLRLGRHHVFGWHWVAGATYSGMVGSHSISLSVHLDVPEVACALCGAGDGSCMARLWRACRAFRRRLGFVRKDVGDVGAATGVALRCHYQPKKHTPCAIVFCGLAHTDWTLTHRVCAS